jgi:hypothetical protein
MPDQMEQSQNTFIVRFWWEWQGGEKSHRTMGWRGRIEHLQSGEGMTFRNAHQLLTFIGRFVLPLESPTNSETSSKEGKP